VDIYLVDMCGICNEEEATEQLPNETGLYVCWSCKMIQRDNMEIFHAMGTTVRKRFKKK